jgi:ABC-type transport system substrate-binding protein
MAQSTRRRGAAARRRWRSGAAGLVVALAISSCGAGDSSSGTGSAESAELDRSATLVASLNGFTQTIDPHKNTGGNRITTLYLSYDRLIHLTPEGELAPGLATEWAVAEDGLSMDLQLREGVVFHDGTPFTAEAVTASLERARTLVDAAPVVTSVAERIAEVEVVDDLSVRLTFTEPFYDVEYNLTAQVGAMISPTALAGGVDLEAEDAGAGPYRLTSWRPGESAAYERFEEYWDADANPVARLELRNTPDTQTRFNAIRSGQVHLTELETSRASDAEAAGLVVNNFDTQGAYMVWINSDLFPEWRTEEVRRAFQHAVDRAGLTTAVTDGLTEPVVQPFGSDHPLYNPDFPGDHYEYDPERARELLDEAGIDDLSLELLVLNRPVDVAIAEALQNQFDEAGVTLRLNVTEPVNFTEFTEGNAQAMLGTWSGRANPVEILRDLYVPRGFLYPGGWGLPDIQEAYEEARSMPPGEEQDEVLREAFGLVAEQAAGLALHTYVASWTTSTCVVGFVPYVTTAPDLRGVGIRSDCR